MKHSSVPAHSPRLRPRAVLAIVLALMLALALASPSLLFAGTYETTWWVDIATDGGEPNSGSEGPVLSGDGRYVVFYSDASDLVDDDTNLTGDVFLYDRQTDSVSRVSVLENGGQVESWTGEGTISADGRFIAFDSPSDYLDGGSAGAIVNTYVVDRTTGAVELVSKSSAGVKGDGDSYLPSLSADGRYVAFHSQAENLVSGDNDGETDIFVHDLETGTTVAASVKSNGDHATHSGSSDPHISATGRYVVFESYSSDLVPTSSGGQQIYLHDLETGATELISVASDGTPSDTNCSNPSVSADGRYVAFQSSSALLDPPDTNGVGDVFVRDRQLGTTERVNVSDTGAQLSTNGSFDPMITSDGRYVMFTTPAPDVVTGALSTTPSRVYVRDLVKDTTVHAGTSYDGVLGNDETYGTFVTHSGNSLFVAFGSQATNLVPENLGGTPYHSFVHEMTDLPGEEGDNGVAGATRYSTAVEVSKASFPSGSDAVILATGRNWPDALGGAALAGAWDAPILLVDTAKVPGDVGDEIERLGATHAIILGGEAVVTEAVETALLSIGDIDTVDRIGGTNRYVTAQLVADAAIAKAGPDWNGTAFVATGANFPDALAGSPLAYANKWPIYLIKPNAAVPTNAMKDDGVANVLLLGGEAVVSEFVEGAFEANFGSAHVARIQGPNRYATAIAVATYGVENAGLHWDGLAFSTGENFPDALAGGSIAGRHDSVMLLVETDALPGTVKTTVTAHAEDITTYSYLGGTAAVQEAVRTEIDAIFE